MPLAPLTSPQHTAYAVCWGLVSGARGTAYGTIIANHFGRSHHGRIMSVQNTVVTGFSAAGTLAFAWAFAQAGGSFAPLLTVLAAACALLALAQAWLM